MIRIYLAAMYSEKNEISAQAEVFRNHGIGVTSTWLEELHHPNIQMSEVATNDLTCYAENDIRDIESADWFVFHSVEPTIPTVRGGRHVEFGYALARGKKILVVGPEENIFHHLPAVQHVNDWESAVNFLINQGE
jgi:nucleoside 2-deoxyribosyltransferase